MNQKGDFRCNKTFLAVASGRFCGCIKVSYPHQEASTPLKPLKMGVFVMGGEMGSPMTVNQVVNEDIWVLTLRHHKHSSTVPLDLLLQFFLTLQELGDKDKNEYIFCLGGI